MADVVLITSGDGPFGGSPGTIVVRGTDPQSKQQACEDIVDKFVIKLPHTGKPVSFKELKKMPGKEFKVKMGMKADKED